MSSSDNIVAIVDIPRRQMHLPPPDTASSTSANFLKILIICIDLEAVTRIMVAVLSTSSDDRIYRNHRLNYYDFLPKEM